MEPILLRNGEQSVKFVDMGKGYRPEWFRQGERPMLRFKDHEWLNVGGVRVTEGAVVSQTATAAEFAGQVQFGGETVAWTCRVSVPADGGSGFTVATRFVPLDEPVEVLEGLTTFELPYEYDATESAQTVICQQPVFKFEGGKEISGAGYVLPLWYYGRMGRAHLTYPSASPMLAHRVSTAGGTNTRCTMILGNWNVCSSKDLFLQPTRNLSERPDDALFSDPHLQAKSGLRGTKFLVGAVNWNNSLNKDPNILVEAGEGLSQEVTVDFNGELPGGTWDAWLAGGWERICNTHFPPTGKVPAFEVAKSQGASWTAAATWLADQIQKPEGYPGFFNPQKGPIIYAPGTRPRWDDGVLEFSGQWTGPLALLGLAWGDSGILHAADRMEELFSRDNSHKPDNIWTIGPTPFYVSVMRKANLVGIADATMDKVKDYITRRAQFVLNPPAGARRGDAGILAWDATANLLAADLFDKAGRESAAKELLARINAKLDGEFWRFNCAAEGDAVGGGQARPFGHAIAMTANVLAWRRFGQAEYLQAAQRFGNLLLGMHCITYNESQSHDLDTRGWCQGSTGGRDQWAQLPPWETGHSMHQLAQLIQAGKGRRGFYDVLWLFARTGLAQFPKARTMKRVYRPDWSVTYRPMAELASEREFYLRLPYLAYENPWDQTMLAGYQGVEPIVFALYLGGGLVAADDDRVQAIVPQAATFDKALLQQFDVELWNPTDKPITTTLTANCAVRRKAAWTYSGAITGQATPQSPRTAAVTVPPRQPVTVRFTLGG